MSRSFVVFGIRTYAAMAQQVARLLKTKLGQVQVLDFPDGERYQRIITKISDKNIVLVGGSKKNPTALSFVKNSSRSVNSALELIPRAINTT